MGERLSRRLLPRGEAMDEWRICWKSTTDSTNADARNGRPGDVFVADFQTAGRGRLDHRWLAPPGVNLMFSAVLDVAGREPVEVATLPLAVGLAVTQAIASLPLWQASPPRLSIKWPNDVLAEGHKLAGILCERNGDAVIAGIGLNVNQTEFVPELASHAVSLAQLAGQSFDRATVLGVVLKSLAAVHARWSTDGFTALHAELVAMDRLRGREVSILQTDTDSAPVTGLCGGIQSDGSLLVGGMRLYAGEAHVISVGA